MPNISNIPVPLYDASDPYHHEFDNAPLKKLIARQELINAVVDSNTALLKAAIGSQGTLANRLNQSLEADGSVKKTAVDDTTHNIGSHVDGLGETSPGASDSVSFIRMKQTERDKLSLIESDSNSLTAEFTTPSTTVSYANGNLDFEPSDTISWHISASKIYANTTFPASSLHQHVYNDTPIHVSDYINYQVNTVPTAYISGSLRVHINGTRIFEDNTVLTPPPASSPSWNVPIAKARLSAATTSIASGSEVALSFDQEVIDTNSYHDTSTNNHRFVIPATGYYFLKCKATLDGGLGDVSYDIRLRIKDENGVELVEEYTNQGTFDTTYVTVSTSGVAYLTAGTWVAAYLTHTGSGSGGAEATNLIGGNQELTYFEIFRLDGATTNNVSLKFTPNPSAGTFSLADDSGAKAITEDDIIIIDYDTEIS